MGVNACVEVIQIVRMFDTNNNRSNSKSCCIKLMFGDMISLRDWTWSNAWSRVNDLWTMRYAIQMVADRLTPALQWTKILPSLRRTESVNNKEKPMYNQSHERNVTHIKANNSQIIEKLKWVISFSGRLSYS